MEKQKKHLDFDLEFLEKRTSSKSEAQIEKENEGDNIHSPSRPVDTSRKYNWKIIFLVSSVVIFFIWMIVSKEKSTNTNTGGYTPPSVNRTWSNDDTVVVGQYRCSQYHYNQAAALRPDESVATFTATKNALEHRAEELDRLRREIETSYVNNLSPQYLIDDYNAKVDRYNSKLSSYKHDATNFDSRNVRFNVQVNTYNNYLIQNCTPAQ